VLVCRDNVLAPQEQRLVNEFLNRPGWAWGWKSRRNTDSFSFWHKHYAGSKGTDHPGKGQELPYDCADELRQRAPVLHQLWQLLARTVLAQHTLVRCYANAHPYGSEGSLHTDSVSPDSFTTIYYPHDRWSPNWGGETCFFNKEETDVIGCVYPKPNRLVVFSGVVPHVARGITRICPALRVTLMFKTQRNLEGTNGGASPREVSH